MRKELDIVYLVLLFAIASLATYVTYVVLLTGVKPIRYPIPIYIILLVYAMLVLVIIAGYIYYGK